MAYITLSKSAFFHNLALLTQRLGDKEKLAVVLKDNAYGHGLLPMAKLSRDFGLQRAVVRNYAEAEMIKAFFDYILILNPVAPHLRHPSYSLTINDISQLEHIPPQSAVELKIDTGMHRNGLHAEDLQRAFTIIDHGKLFLKGVMTHFRSADLLSSELFWQQQQWKEVKREVKRLCTKHSLPIPLFHSANSAAALRLNRYDEDFARCGIAAFGYHEMDSCFGTFDLKPVLQLHARKITTLQLKKGERIGYGGSYTAAEDMVVSTYDVGYGDGFFRYDGEGDFQIAGKKVLGKISMDSLSLPGDEEEVTVLEDAKAISRSFGTIAYDVLVKLNPHIERIIVR